MTTYTPTVKMPEIIAITVSTNYDDILDIIIPRNAPFFAKWIIITDQNDTATLEVIKKYNYHNISVLFFDFIKGNKKFNKGGAIRYAQKKIRKTYTGLVLLIDSDILLPINFKEIIQSINFDSICLYGAETRVDFYSYSHLVNNIVDFEFPRKNYLAGFFHLYKYNPQLLYKNSINCSTCDIEFEALFKECLKRIYGLHVKHLGMNHTNWDARANKTDFLMDCPRVDTDLL